MTHFNREMLSFVLVCALEVTGDSEVLNMSLQSRIQNLDGMLSAVACVKER